MMMHCEYSQIGHMTKKASDLKFSHIKDKR